MHQHDVTGPLLDERGDLLRGLAAALHRPPLPLTAITDPSPGAYLLLYRGPLDEFRRVARPGGVDDRRSMVEGGGYPIYAGSASSLGQRVRRHVLNLRPCVDVTADDLLMVPLPTATPAGALYVEAALISSLRPVWNEAWLAGFGSQPQGAARRRHQRVPPWNVLHPGRRFDSAAPRPDITREALADRVVEFLAATVPAAFTHQPAPMRATRLTMVR